MKCLSLLFLGALSVWVTGCRSFQSISLEAGPTYPASGAVYDSINFGFNLNAEKIDTTRSYAISPGDKRYPGHSYKLDVEPNVGKNAIFLKQEKVDANVYLVQSNGSRLKKISSGVWSFHFVVERNGTVEVIDQRWRITSTAPTLILGGR